jgi:hypothetical protein
MTGQVCRSLTRIEEPLPPVLLVDRVNAYDVCPKRRKRVDNPALFGASRGIVTWVASVYGYSRFQGPSGIIVCLQCPKRGDDK